MKKITMIFLAIICSVLMPLNTMAASGSISVTSSSTAVVGNKITVTVTLENGSSKTFKAKITVDKRKVKLAKFK